MQFLDIVGRLIADWRTSEVSGELPEGARKQRRSLSRSSSRAPFLRSSYGLACYAGRDRSGGRGERVEGERLPHEKFPPRRYVEPRVAHHDGADGAPSAHPG